jgi:hypothetical protein
MISTFSHIQFSAAKPMKFFASLTVIVLVFGMTACSKGPKTGEVHGKVTLDGIPLKKGKVEFIPVDGTTSTSGAMIEDGKFTIERVPVTKQRVQFTSRILTTLSGSPATPGTPDEQTKVVSIVPERYNKNSDFVLDVKPGLNEPATYELKSK